METQAFEFWKLNLVPMSAKLRNLRHREGTGWAGRSGERVAVALSVLRERGAYGEIAPQAVATDSVGEVVDVCVAHAQPEPAGGDGHLLPLTLGLDWRPVRTIRIRGRTAPDEPVEDWLLLRPDAVFPAFIPETVQRLAGGLGRPRFTTLVETGTLFAHTAAAMGACFEQVFSIELSAELHRRARDIDGLPATVTFLEGDSAAILPDLVARIGGPAVFFLDAHWSGPRAATAPGSPFRGYPVATAHRGTAGEAPPADAQLPLGEEVVAIIERFAHPAIIIVDDWHAIGRSGVGWASQDWTGLTPDALLALFGRSSRLVEHTPIDRQRWSFSLKGLDRDHRGA